MAQRKWKDLSPRTRGLLIAGVAVESALKTAALVDIARRPASEIRGPKWMWVPVVVLVNSFGAVPAAYFLYGRRQRN